MVAVTALATLPCVVLLMISWSQLFDRVGERMRGRRKRRSRYASISWRDRRRLAKLDRTLHPAEELPVEPPGPPIEKIAADLRRLRRQRTGIALRSPVWFSAIEKAYDDRIRWACQRLDIDSHLDELTGVDRDIERVRLEGELEAAGLSLRGYEAAAS
jgi:hypothetical protein